MDLALLVARDHEQLDAVIGLLVDPLGSQVERREALESVRISFASHADAESMVLHGALSLVAAPQDFAGVVAQVLAAHRTQEAILRRMDHGSRGDWLCAAIRLRRSLAAHATHEHKVVMPALRACVPTAAYARLASSYAAEKLRALTLLTSLSPRRRMRRDTAEV